MLDRVAITVVPSSPEWPEQFARIAAHLADALADVPVVAIEHVGSTSVPGLAAKPVIDVDVIVRREDVGAAIAALVAVGYTHRGDLGVIDREALAEPDAPRRNVYVCVEGTLHVRNHLAVRDILRRRPDLRDRYGAVKTALAQNPDLGIDAYLAGKSPVLQDVLAESDLTAEEKDAILRLNTGT